MAVQDRAVTSTAVAAGQRQVVTFRVDGQEYALDIANIVQVVRMVTITESGEKNDVVEGIINLRGKVVPVINLRKRFGAAKTSFGLNDHLLIARTAGRVVALIVDSVSEVLIIPSARLEEPSDIAPQMMEYLSAVAKLGDRLLLIVDLEGLLPFKKPPRDGIGDILQDAVAMQQRLQTALAQAMST